MDELLSQEPSPLLFLSFPPDTLSLAEATGAFASQESKRIPEIILKRLAPGERGSCPVPGARGEPSRAQVLDLRGPGQAVEGVGLQGGWAQGR